MTVDTTETTRSVAPGVPAPDSPRGRQLKAALALQHLLSHDLPAAIWRIDGDSRIEGQITSRQDAVVADLITWATFIGAEPTARPYAHNKGKTGAIEAVAVYRDVQVRMWNGMKVADMPAEWLKRGTPGGE